MLMKILVLLISILFVVSYAMFPTKMMILKSYSHGFFGHFIAFFFLSFIFITTTKLRIYWQILILFSLGIAIEFLQMLTTYRNASIEDILYDAVGIFIFYGLFFIFQKIKK